MHAGTLRDLLAKLPFQPLRVVVLEATTYEVRNQELAILEAHTLTIFDPAGPDRLNFTQTQVIISLGHISKLEIVTAGEQDANGIQPPAPSR